ncbi:salicyl-AMP ligase [Methylobacterium tarhaniae]|uniref:Salicyl-AMP ligase n=2 Tax=Methylobacterium tarhaniae TaxID=1187852 RepID=A0A0J6SXP2_9HYPH|nr:salicyl-AMP ligase [Methylobacterium tarhaniae]
MDAHAPTLFACLHEAARRHGGRTALVCEETRLDYATLFARAGRLAGGLRERGIARGDRVLVQMPNGVAFVEILLACLWIEAVPVLVMPNQRTRDVEALCRIAEPVACFVPGRTPSLDYPDLAARTRDAQPSLRHVIVDGEAGTSIALRDIDGAPPEPPSCAPDDVALLLISGGTTGIPKLIPRTHGDYAYNIQAMAAASGLAADSVYLAVIPVAHNFALGCPGILGTLAQGGTVVLSESAGCDEAMPVIAREGVTHVALVPPLAKMWVDARDCEDSDLSSLRVVQVGGSRLAPDLAGQIEPRLGGRLQQVFGMAEGLLCLTRLDDDPDTILGTQGRPLSPDDVVRVVDADGRDVARGERGELWTRGPYTIRGYFRAEEHNRQAFTPDGFYRTGDLVRWHGDNLVVDGRVKEQVHRGGEKLSVVEIEDALRSLDGIDAAKVVAVPDDVLGERACAFLIGASGNLDEVVLRSRLAALGLSREKIPDQFEWLSSWPLTAVGKIDTQQLVPVAQKRDR